MRPPKSTKSVVRVGMRTFTVTFASKTGFSGLAVWLSHSKFINVLPTAFTLFGELTDVALAIAAAAHLMLSRSLLGPWLYAVGHIGVGH